MYDTAAFKMGILLADSASNQACANLEITNDACNVSWLYTALEGMRPFFLSQRRGIRQKNLSLKMMKEFRIPLPPYDLQQQFAAIVDSVEQQKADMRSHLAELDALFAALQSRAFNGEL